MLRNIDILLKCILLLYRENELRSVGGETSKDLVKTILSLITNKKQLMGGDSDIVSELKALVLNMVNNPDGYDKLSLVQSLSLILKDRDKEGILKSIVSQIENDILQASMVRSINTLRNHLNDFYRQTCMINMIYKASYELSSGRVDDNIRDYVSKFITDMEAFTVVSKTKDPGIVDEIDLSDGESMEVTLSKVKEQSTDDGRLKSGWRELNELLGGGFRPGEMVLTSALQHNYKSGFVQSLFAQLCMYNFPKPRDKNKRPLNLLISFEDDSDVVVKFLYNYLHYSEFGQLPDIQSVSNQEITSYMFDQLTKTGFAVKILRVNPSEWTYKHLFNKVLEYEAQGYELHVLVVDYLSKMPTTGCITSGPMGTDVRDLFTRIRDFISAKGILFITPHQMSVDAKQLLRNGVPPVDLVKEVAGKGYYDGSKQLDQVVDLELYQAIARINRKPYLVIQRGKRRYPEIIDDEKKYFKLPFPNKCPIPPNMDINGEYKGFAYEAAVIPVAKSENIDFDF